MYYTEAQAHTAVSRMAAVVVVVVRKIKHRPSQMNDRQRGSGAAAGP